MAGSVAVVDEGGGRNTFNERRMAITSSAKKSKAAQPYPLTSLSFNAETGEDI